MDSYWYPDDDSSAAAWPEGGLRQGFTLFIPAVAYPIVFGAALAGVLAIGSLVRQNRALQDELRHESGSAAQVSGREHELEASIARQHHDLQVSESALQSLRMRVEAVELQLDGVDYLSRQLRIELGLPASAGSWGGQAGGTNPPAGGQAGAASPPAGSQASGANPPANGFVPAPGLAAAGPQGGADDPSAPLDQSRVALAQQRLATGLAELYNLLEYTRLKRFAEAANAVSKVAPPAGPLQPTPANWPARGEVTSVFGWRVFRGVPNFHSGIDVAVRYGTPVLATADGLTVGSGWQPGYGLCVLLQHGNGYNTLYAHLSDTAVKLGDVVKPGTPIGWSGSSGNSTGPHLHYEVWQRGKPLDPRPFMDGAPDRAPGK